MVSTSAKARDERRDIYGALKRSSPRMNAGAPTFPRVNAEAPTFPRMNAEAPTYPRVNAELPPFPRVRCVGSLKLQRQRLA
jgi:hypothetical protein